MMTTSIERQICGGCCASTNAALRTCGTCKWLRYCSRECQAADWKRGHRAMCPILARVERFRALEAAWWATRPPAELAALRDDLGLEPSSMAFYGEVLFVLAGLKPCVLLSNLPSASRRSFVVDVIRGSGLLDMDHHHRLALGVIADGVTTAADHALGGTLVLADPAHVAGVTRSLQLRPISDGDDDDDSAWPMPSTTSTAIVPERTLAQWLDYPVALDECLEGMIEVGYFHQLADGGAADKPQQRRLLTSYCATATDEHRRRIAAHFRRYQARLGSALSLSLTTTGL